MPPHLVVSLTSERQEYQSLQADEAREAGGRLGIGVEVLFADDNGVVQIQQLFRSVHAPSAERPAALLVHTRVADGLERLARNAARAGIGWVLLNRTAPYLEALRREHPSLLVAAVLTDHGAIGRIHARQLDRLRPGADAVLYVQGPADAPAAGQRLLGFEEALVGRAVDIKVVNGDWTAAGAERAIASWLRLKTAERFSPAAVVCQNDSMARGARAALSRLRPEWAGLPFLGCDGLPGSGRLDVDEGRLAATVVIPSCGAPAVEIAARWAGTGSLPPLETVLAPVPHPPV